MGLFVSGPDPLHGAVKGGVHSLWMAGRSQLWRLDNLLSHGQTHEGATHLTMPQSPRWHLEKLWLLKMARVQAC